MKNYKTYRKLFLLTVIICPFANFAGTSAQNKTTGDTAINYLFVEWQHWSNTIVLGHFSENKKRRIADNTFSINELTEANIHSWLKDADAGVLISFHCMWGQQPWFHRIKYLSSFHEVLSSQKHKSIKTVISFIWHAGGLFYKKNWNLAAGKGAAAGKFLSLVNGYYHCNTYIFCHSMGSRFFEGVLQSMPPQEHLFRAVVLFSADLPADVNEPGFQYMLQSAASIAVFQHRKDKLLWFSSFLFNKQRLGRSGPLPVTAQTKITVFDMTEKVKGFQNHAHINKKWVKATLSSFLAGFSDGQNRVK